MATQYSAALFPDNSTDANFRAWVQFIFDTLVTTGVWVQTADTGQLTISTASHPTVANTKVGYVILRMDDTLQATAPVFIKLEFGSAAAANTPGVWITVGEGSDTTGGITSIRYNGGISATPQISANGSQTTAVWESFGSADTGRAHVALFVNSGTNRVMLFSIERSRDSTGTKTGDGVYLVYSSAGIVAFSKYIAIGTASQPPADTGVQYVLSSANPSGFGGNVGIGMPVPMKGYALQPLLGIIITRQNDWVAGATITATIYGATRTFQHLYLITTNYPNGGNDATSRVAVRYD